MTDKEFPCRTKTITGITYNLTLYRKDGSVAGFCGSFSTKELAEQFAENMSNENTRVEITSREWTETVCIECGREEY